ncbi:MAG: putative peptidoglycan glycosyltransferase FtsW [Victivallales bacterium]
MAQIRFASQIILNEDETSRWPHPKHAALILAITVLSMVLFGLAMLYSTSSGIAGATLFRKQMIWASVGIIGAMCVYLAGYRNIVKLSIVLIVFSALLLILARLNRPINGAYRWIQFHGLSIQPSELAKISLILFLASFCSVRQRFMNSFMHGLLPAGLVCGLICGLVLVGKDLGTTFLLLVTIWAMMFAVGVRLAYLLLGPMLVPFVFFYVKFMDAERWSRITSFMDPELVAKDSGYQLWNSLMALGSGFWGGLGFTQSRLKWNYLPEAHTDFILSIVGEELGFIAILLVIFGYITILLSSVYISIMSKDRQGMLLGFGISVMLTMQAVINIGVISGSFPTKGIPAPFISYGGSNLMMSIVCVGLLLSIAMDSGTGNEPSPSEIHPSKISGSKQDIE